MTKTKSPYDKTTSKHSKPKPSKRPIAFGSVLENEAKKKPSRKPKPPVRKEILRTMDIGVGNIRSETASHNDKLSLFPIISPAFCVIAAERFLEI